LEHLGAGPELTVGVLHIIDRFIAGGPGDSADAKVFFDAHLLASYEEKTGALRGVQSDETDNEQKQYFTDTGKRLSLLFH
jgi:hypothetical protein